jgi:hypothetical protein
MASKSLPIKSIKSSISMSLRFSIATRGINSLYLRGVGVNLSLTLVVNASLNFGSNASLSLKLLHRPFFPFSLKNPHSDCILTFNFFQYQFNISYCRVKLRYYLEPDSVNLSPLQRYDL